MKIVHGCAGLVLLAALATTASATPDEIRVYDPGILTRDRYEIVARLWVESWRSAFRVPTHADRTAAVAALKAEAAQRGANALTNVACLTDDGSLWGIGPRLPLWGADQHFCYALAIRVK